ncbi:MAG: hypothetical protein ABJC07_05365 [Acidobacteriota bacterium]
MRRPAGRGHPTRSTGKQTVSYANFGEGNHKFYGAEVVLDKRFSDHWNANVSYAHGKTKTNTTSSTASSLGDYLTSNCRTTVDTTIGTNGDPLPRRTRAPCRGSDSVRISHVVPAARPRRARW